ncbi:sulfonate ABC transporter substrate-binding protein [Burkholderia vietnamiensis]|uniref:sulfonate ABC transporter substrate-binding protein n=1 Tax=Burkholderia vietnamiensis TaxID=60552 RepID=UPI001B961F50|nr:sulfonate ABC transporter substrate-binding protein [Burkholderia vietnamiensis]MBR8005957.1 sulfonate ABC transporter substrate-binding protein [Burkholderia vietnamiensis]
MNDLPPDTLDTLDTPPQSTRRRRWLQGTAAALAGVALGPLAGLPARAQAGGTRLRIGFQKYGNFVVLKARGTLEKRLASQGVTVEWLEFPAGPQLLEGLNAGAIDVGTVGETPPIFAQAAGVDFVYIGNEPPAPRGEAIVVLPDSPIRTLAQLRGKKVALNKGSNVHYLLVKALEHAGIPYTDIQPIFLTPADARAAFVQRNVDAWVIWDPYLAAAERQLGARVVANGEGLVRNTQYYLAARRYARAQPQILRALLDEVDAVDRWGRDHVGEVAAQLSPLVGLDTATLEVALKRTGYGVQPVSDATLAYQQNIADAFSALKLIPGHVSVADAR